MLSHHGETQVQGNATHARNDTQPHERNGTQSHIVHYTANDADDMSDADTKSCVGCDSPEKIISFVSLLFVVLTIL